MNRRLMIALGLTLIICGAASAATQYSDSIDGGPFSPGRSGSVAFAGEATGDLPGRLTINVERDGSGAVTGGTWMLVVNDGTAMRGMLRGTVVSGSTTVAEDGSLLAASELRLAVSGGTGAFESVGSGSGSANVTSVGHHRLAGKLSLSM